MVTKQGLYIQVIDGKNVLTYNGKHISATMTGHKAAYGLYVNGGKLDVDGSVVASTSVQNPSVHQSFDNVYFGNVRLDNEGECVNITESDYNSLLAGGTVDGYKSYSPSTVYNIVDNPATALKITYNVVGDNLVFSSGVTAQKGASGVYNSIAGELTENTESLTATIESTSCPFVHVRYFKPVILVGSTIELEYFVDTKTMSSVNYDTVHNTFTLVVKVGNTTLKKTTYAGMFKITLPQFNTAGINWFSVRCIDSNGVGSVEQFFDVLVKEQHTDVVYTMTYNDLEEFTYNGSTYQIVPNDDTVTTAFANKAALTAFFAKVKANGYDRVIMYNDPTDNDGAGTIYWIDYHGVFGTQTYYKCGISNNKISSVELTTENEVPTIWTRVTDRTPKVGKSYTSSNSYEYFVINTSVSSGHILFPNYFTVDLNSSTIAATQSYDLGRGELINLYNNTDTHLINGYVKGNASGFDFSTSRKRSGDSTEWMSVVSMTACKYCSFENLDVSGAEGFDASLHPTGTTGHTKLETIGLSDNSSVILATGENITVENMVRSGYFSVSEGEMISIGRNGYNMYLNMGPEREFFYVFYNSSNEYVGFVKSHFYRITKVPVGATKAKIVGYGKIQSQNSTDDTDWNVDTNLGLLYMFKPSLCHNVEIKNCYWHDTRTTAITNTTARGALIENCTYKNIAIGDSVGGVVTPLLGDLEDSWQWASNITIKDCNWISSNGYHDIKVYYANSFEFLNNKGFDYCDGGGVECGVIENNDIGLLEIRRNRSCYYPNIIYRNNNIKTLNVLYGIAPNKNESVSWTHTVAEKIVSMVDTKIKNECKYAYLHLKRSVNGILVID